MQARYPQVEFVRVTEEADLPAGLADADVFFGFSLRSDGPVVDAPNRRSGRIPPFVGLIFRHFRFVRLGTKRAALP
jgi:hypothetical protein